MCNIFYHFCMLLLLDEEIVFVSQNTYKFHTFLILNVIKYSVTVRNINHPVLYFLQKCFGFAITSRYFYLLYFVKFQKISLQFPS